MKGSESYQSDAPEPQSLGCCLGLVSDGLGESYRVNHRVVRAEAAPSLTAVLGDRYVAGRCPEEQTVTGEVELVAVGDVVRRLRQALAEVLPSLAAVVRAAHSHRTPLGDAKLVALHRLDPGTVWILGVDGDGEIEAREAVLFRDLNPGLAFIVALPYPAVIPLPHCIGCRFSMSDKMRVLAHGRLRVGREVGAQSLGVLP